MYYFDLHMGIAKVGLDIYDKKYWLGNNGTK